MNPKFEAFLSGLTMAAGLNFLGYWFLSPIPGFEPHIVAGVVFVGTLFIVLDSIDSPYKLVAVFGGGLGALLYVLFSENITVLIGAFVLSAVIAFWRASDKSSVAAERSVP